MLAQHGYCPLIPNTTIPVLSRSSISFLKGFQECYRTPPPLRIRAGAVMSLTHHLLPPSRCEGRRDGIRPHHSGLCDTSQDKTHCSHSEHLSNPSSCSSTVPAWSLIFHLGHSSSRDNVSPWDFQSLLPPSSAGSDSGVCFDLGSAWFWRWARLGKRTVGPSTSGSFMRGMWFYCSPIRTKLGIGNVDSTLGWCSGRSGSVVVETEGS